ncbi:MAG: aldose 1-epimerase family protein [Lachnospiraceae bacterium]
MSVHVLENEMLKVTVADSGAELISVFDKENETERMWDADPAVWNRHAPILFPFIGKTAGGMYRYKGNEYAMKTQHGFARDMEFCCVSEDGQSVTHCLKATEDTRKIYPFDFELYVTHSLDSASPRKVKVQWEIKNKGGEAMLYSIGGHPGFRTPAKETEDRSDYYLEFPQKDTVEYILINPSTGLAVRERTYRLQLENGFYPIARNLFDKDALIFEESQIEKVRISKPDKTPYVTLECVGFPYVGIWSKPEGNFVCLEPWYGRTDNDGFAGPLQEKEGEQVLPAGESKTIEYTIEFHK